MIHTFGLHWKKDYIHWGSGSNAGHLNGVNKRSRNADLVDFRKIRGIYSLYSDYELMYIGQAGTGNTDLFNRLKTHRDDHLAERWNRFSWFGFQYVTRQHKLSMHTKSLTVKKNVAFNILEAVVIAIAEPKLNLQRGRWGKNSGEAIQYYQWAKDDSYED